MSKKGPLDRAIHLVARILVLFVGLFLLEGLQGSVVGLVAALLGLLPWSPAPPAGAS